jgi:hypothetical protein
MDQPVLLNEPRFIQQDKIDYWAWRGFSEPRLFGPTQRICNEAEPHDFQIHTRPNCNLFSALRTRNQDACTAHARERAPHRNR